MNRYLPIVKITGSYLIVATIWILFSDQILALLITDQELYIRAQTAKGGLFVIVTAIILFNTILREFQRHWEYERELETIAAFIKDLRGILEPHQLVLKILAYIRNLFHAETVFYGMPEPLLKGVKISLLNRSGELVTQFIPSATPFIKRTIDEVKTVSSLQSDSAQERPEFLSPAESKYAITPLIAREKVIGIVGFGKAGSLLSSDVHLLQAVAEISSQVFYAADLLHNNAIQIQRLSTFRKIDETILSNFNTSELINLLLKEFTSVLGSDAASVTVIDTNTQSLEYYLHSGLESFDEQYCEEAGNYAINCDSILVIQNTKSGINSQRTFPSHHPIGDPFLIGYALAPLINMGQLLGIVEIFSKKEINWDREKIQFFEALAQQTAIAIDKVRMVVNLQKSNVELIQSYEETLEGWSRAMDTRDHETENHTQRVTSLTIKMGEKLGLSQEQLVQMRRGALLHDIGKLGVPDHILLKKGSLTDDEWAIMRRHPTTAKELIEPIGFLSPAITIPYFHHEKWDGSGYPQGLKGEEIPIEARIFSIVDVWDALTSDRPYRDAMDPLEAARYIYHQSGQHFDPQVVTAFMELLIREGLLTTQDLMQMDEA